MSIDKQNILFTIGASSHRQEAFLGLLKDHDIGVVVDVRSAPYSRFTPQFNKDAIETALRDAGIRYLFMGQEFGARRDEASSYDGDRVCFARVFKQPLFLQGVDRLLGGLEKAHRIALMCTEKDPIDCHRTIMVTRYLAARNHAEIRHIHFDGHIETNHAFEERLQQTAGVAADLFVQDRDELVEMAYQKIERKVAYKKEASCP